MSENIVTEGVMSGLETAAKSATPGPNHIYTHFRDDNNHKSNQWFFENCWPQYVLELISRVRAAESEVAGHRNMLKAECLRLSSGDVVVITLAQRHLQFGAQWDHYRQGLLSTLPPGVNALIVSEGVSMSVLTDEQLAEAGLKRADQPWTDDGTTAPTPDDYRELQAQYDQLQTQLFNERQKSAALAAEVDACNDRNGELEDARAALDKQLSSRISRTVDIEDLLLKMANGKLALPDKQDCRVLSLRLGTPKKDWSDIVKNHQFIQLDDKE